VFPGFRPKSAGDFFSSELTFPRGSGRKLGERNTCTLDDSNKAVENLLNGSGVDGFFVVFSQDFAQICFYLPSLTGTSA